MTQLVEVKGEIIEPFAQAQAALRQRIGLIEQEMRKRPQVELPLYHHFPQPGVYVRELHIPKGVMTVGKIHKYPCWNILSKGERATVVGDHIEHIRAPHVHWTPSGSKRISYTLEDSIWLTVHLTRETDIAALERELVAETEEEFQQFIALVNVEALSSCPS